MAEQLIDSLSSTWEPDEVPGHLPRPRLDLIKRKAKGEDIVVEERGGDAEGRRPHGGAARQRRGVQEARKVAPSAAQVAPTDLDDLSKDELYERAGEADIAGRSKMSKDELIKALQKAS